MICCMLSGNLFSTYLPFSSTRKSPSPAMWNNSEYTEIFRISASAVVNAKNYALAPLPLLTLGIAW